MKYKYDVVSIIDQIGTYETDKLKNGNKLCPYFFATRKKLLMKYLDIDWNSHLPHSETLGLLTEAMLNDGIKVYEMQDDKSGIMFDGTQQYPEQHVEGGRGYYHIRAGSTPAYLLATKKYGDIKTYEDYLKNQPKNEYLRQCAFYCYMTGNINSVIDILKDSNTNFHDFIYHFENFKEYHGL